MFKKKKKERPNKQTNKCQQNTKPKQIEKTKKKQQPTLDYTNSSMNAISFPYRRSYQSFFKQGCPLDNIFLPIECTFDLFLCLRLSKHILWASYLA